MEKSDSIKLLTAALIQAQGELQAVPKDTQAYNYKYATLHAVWEEYKTHFLKHGLVVIQQVEVAGLRTTLAHESGEWLSSVANLMPIKNDPQAQGSAITYMRRYSLGAICGIMTEDDDDDGKKAMPTHGQAEKPAAAHAEIPAAPKTGNTNPKHTDMGAAAPKQGLSATGLVFKIFPPNSGGYVSVCLEGFKALNGYDMKFATKNPEYIAMIEESAENGDKLHIDYDEVANGRYTNYNITNVMVISNSVPF